VWLFCRNELTYEFKFWLFSSLNIVAVDFIYSIRCVPRVFIFFNVKYLFTVSYELELPFFNLVFVVESAYSLINFLSYYVMFDFVSIIDYAAIAPHRTDCRQDAV